MGNGLLGALGLTPPSGGGAPVPGGDLAGAIGNWRSAVDSVDAQIAKLQSVLRSSGDEELRAIAEFGLNAVTGNHKARLMAILMEARDAQGEGLKRLATKGLGLVGDFQKHLGSEEVAAVDNNPFKVKVAVRPTLGPALLQLAHAFEAIGRPG